MTVDNHTKEIELSQQTLSELQKNNIPPTPKCYEVMYHFLKNDNIELTNAINKFLETNEQISEILLLKIHASILSYETMARTVNIVTNLLTKQLTSFNDSVSTSDQELNVFADAINSFSQYIDDDINVTNDNNIITYITEATSRIKNKIKELDNSLNTSQDEIRKLQSYLENMCQESMMDPLTSLSTRKRTDQVLSISIRNSLETSQSMSVLFIEVDHYDDFYKKWGQVTSEQILRFIASSLRENIKGRDTAARYSTSLFLLILPKTTSTGAFTLAEHIRNTIERKRIIKKTTGEFLGRVTVSCGISEFRTGESVGCLVNRAEKILSIAKQNGRNCTMTEKDAENFIVSHDNITKAS
ncbi:MAG: diguanylate cyclase [Alphaproteobacteria bacterium]|jgi:diguanylate cyclase